MMPIITTVIQYSIESLTQYSQRRKINKTYPNDKNKYITIFR